MIAHQSLLTRRRTVLGLGAALYVSRLSTAHATAEAVLEPGHAASLGVGIVKAFWGGARRIRLLPGQHGPLVLQGLRGGRLDIVGEPGAIVGATVIRGCEGLTVQEVAFRGAVTDDSIPGLVVVDQSTRDATFERCSFATEENSAAWTAQDWITKPYRVGLFVRGRAVTVSDSRFFNLRNCLYLGGDGGVAKSCTFEAFGNDAIELAANELRILSNKIRGSHHTPAEQLHADGIQGFPAPNGGVFRNVTIDGNTVEYIGPGDYMQGITVFDGRWQTLRVTNNTVRVNVWNAISLYGVDDVLVEGNTVSSTDPKVLNWIEVRAAKDGTPSSGVVVRDNVAPVFRTAKDATVARNQVRLR